MPNVTVQLSLRIDPAEYEQFRLAAEQAALSVPMWLVRCARAEITREGACDD